MILYDIILYIYVCLRLLRKYVFSILRRDREFIMLAVALNGLCLQYACAELRCDRQVVLQAIRCNPLALEHADSRMKRDRLLVFRAFLPVFTRFLAVFRAFRPVLGGFRPRFAPFCEVSGCVSPGFRLALVPSEARSCWRPRTEGPSAWATPSTR